MVYPLVRRSKLQAGIPIQLSTGITASNSDFTGATNQNINTFSENRFNQTHFGGGTGAYINFNPSRKIQFQNTATVGYALAILMAVSLAAPWYLLRLAPDLIF